MRIYQEKNKQRNAILLQFSLLTDLVPSLGQPNGNYVKTVRMLDNHQNYFNEQILEYAKSGAVKRLQRRGRKNDGYSGKIDNLHITVKGNRLHYVSDDADKLQYDGAFDFNGDASNCSAFQYNANGSLNDVNASSCIGWHYYNRDHLGNNRAVISHSGTVEQVTHYYPFGAVYGDAGSNDALQRYKYNGKELDRMHGLNFYDYGVRQYDPLLCKFTQVDPLAEKYFNISPYAYCANNPVNAIDPDGKKIVFVNGYLGLGSPEGGETYWNGINSSFVKRAQSTLNDNMTPYFTNYDFNYLKSASMVREFLGYQYAKDNYKALTEGMNPKVDKFNFISHSMGGAFSEGMIKYLVEPDIPLSDYRIRIESNSSIKYIHKDLIDSNYDLWKSINNLLSK